jgi:Tfp pilus assembly protein PilP
MNTKVAAAFAMIVGGFTVGYSLYETTASSGIQLTARAARPPVDARSNALTNEIARLHRRQEHGAAPGRVRDVFRFAAQRQSARNAPRALPPPTAAPPAPVPVRPALKLIGVAEDDNGGSPVRMAIISAPDQLYMVREGERVAARYGVKRISSDVVELVDAGDDSAFRLVLK